ncbi:hormogonium polysaccharide biosynthesis protein HpsA, partial [Microcoleus sp. Pol12B5]
VVVNGIAAGTWGNWNAAWSSAPAAPALPDATNLPTAQNNPNFVRENAATARQFAKGDLRMRATAVYHYANSGYDPTTLAAAPIGTQPQQTPLACISSYYDPSNASTARNITTTGLLPDVSGQGAAAPIVVSGTLPTLGTRQAFIGSNNGITYGPPTRPRPGGNSTPNPATGLLSGSGDTILETQANLVFPDGRFANGPLRTALQVPAAQRTLAQNAAIDSTNCALQILDGTIGAPNPAQIPHGAIQEVAFLNGREVKAIDRDNLASNNVNEAFTLSSPLPANPQAATLTGNYDQPLEERQPLEIRATQLDLNALRGQNIAGPNATPPEWLLPNSGIIYASRDDALPDRSARFANPAQSTTVSPTDNLLDPTRKPNGIVLINGQQLFRGGATPTRPNNINAVVREKGLTLVSNLPAYIQGAFNLHGTIPAPAPGVPPNNNPVPVEEFTQLVNPTWTNFYGRTQNQLDPNFACRAGDPRLPNCTTGDFWRPANILADAVTLLSQSYRFGFRNEGDFDLRNNAGAAAVLPRRQQGFFNNNFVTNGLSSGAFSNNGNLVGTPNAPLPALTDITYQTPALPLSSSYFNNFVTPIQRRGNFPEYVMETCIKLPVAACTNNDWFVNPLAAAPISATDAITIIPPAAPTYATPTNNASFYQAGSTVDPPLPALQRFPRRVAFLRNPTTTPPANQLATPAAPQPLGIAAGGAIVPGAAGANTRPNSLWFAGSNGPAVNFDNVSAPYVVNPTTIPPNTRDGANVLLPALTIASPPPATSGLQPLLLPVPQIQTLSSAANPPGGNIMPRGTTIARNTGWIAQAVNTTFNLIVGAGDTPSRTLNANTGDFNGGLQNLPRFLESWNNGGFATNIRGSFIQQNRSALSTAPYQPILSAPALVSLFQLQVGGPFPAPASITNTYNTDAGAGLIPYFSPPLRNWGYDVGLLSQSPDLFTQRFTTPATRTQPAEYFREVPRNDNWVKTLMCGVVAPNQPNGGQIATALRSNCPT